MNKKKKSDILIYIVISIFFFVTFYPFLLLLFGSLKDKLQLVQNPWVPTFPLHFQNYALAFKQIAMPMLNSIIIVGIGIVMVVCISAIASYAFARCQFPGSGLLYTMIIALMMIPGFTTLVPQLMLIKNMKLYDTYAGVILPIVTNNTALGIMLMTAFFRDIPTSLIEAAKLEGCSEFQIFHKIVLPLSKPIVSAVSIMCGLRLWNNYIWPLVSTTQKTRPVIVAISRISTLPSQGNGPLYAAYVLASLPLIILFFIFSKSFVAGLTAGAVKG